MLKIFYSYFFDYWGHWAPVTTSRTDVTHIIVQAFGRDALPDKDLGSFAKTLPQKKKMVYALSYCGKDAMGSANYALADVLYEEMKRSPHAQAYVQWEIAVALYESRYEFLKKERNRIHAIWPTPACGNRFTTTDVAHAAKSQIVKGSGELKILTIAHAAMLSRARLIARKHFGSTPVISARQVTRNWSQNSVQWQVRGPVRWFIREVATRVHHLLNREVW